MIELAITYNPVCSPVSGVPILTKLIVINFLLEFRILGLLRHHHYRIRYFSNNLLKDDVWILFPEVALEKL